jgi:hypothetical protein
VFALEGERSHDLNQSCVPFSDKHTAYLKTAMRKPVKALHSFEADGFKNRAGTHDLSIQ